RRVVERVLAALRLHLDKLFLDRRDLRLERACAPAHASAGSALGTLLPPFDLRPKGADRVDRLVYFTELVADPHAQRELRVEVGLRRGHAWVLADLERGFVPLATGLEANAVLARRRDRPRERRLRRLPCRVVLNARGVRVSHIPREAVEPNLVRDLRLARLFYLLGPPLFLSKRGPGGRATRFASRLGWCAPELSGLFALCVF